MRIIVASDFIRGDFCILIFMKEVMAMEKLTFVQIQKNNPKHYEDAALLWIPFIRELNSHRGVIDSEDTITGNLKKRIAIQGTRPDMHFEIAYQENKPTGIANFGVDLGTIYGLIEAGYGTVMGCYIKPEMRRKGFGREFFAHIENTLRRDGAKLMYVCPDEVTGKPFWKAMGFTDSGKMDPDEKLSIYTKEISEYIVSPAAAQSAMFVHNFYAQNINALHGKEISRSEWKEILSKDDPDEQNFLICKDAIPVAWLRVNGLMNKDMAWISMLAVSGNVHHQGIGTFSVGFAEDFARSKGFLKMGIHTTDDNISAQGLYKKFFYTITFHGECTTGDGKKRLGYTFTKEL